MQKDVEEALDEAVWGSVSLGRSSHWMGGGGSLRLPEEKSLLPLWNKFVERGDVPFVKILADGEDAEYQFRCSSKNLTKKLG